MMQATDLRNRHDLSNRLDRPGIWRIFFQGQMTSRIEVVADVSFQRPSQMPLSKNDHVIETLSANATDEPFRKWILPWTSCCGQHLVNAHSLNSVVFKITKPAMCRPLLTLGFDETLKSRRIFAAVTCLRD